MQIAEERLSKTFLVKSYGELEELNRTFQVKSYGELAELNKTLSGLRDRCHTNDTTACLHVLKIHFPLLHFPLPHFQRPRFYYVYLIVILR